MKTKILFSAAAALFAVLFPFLVAKPAVGEEIKTEDISEIRVSEKADDVRNEEKTTVRLLKNGEVTEIGMNEYLFGVVAAEMPCAFETEALKAQAVAARTFTMYRNKISGSPNHPEADACTDPGCCKAYADENTLTECWKEDYEENYLKIKSAVLATDGEYLTYEDELILAAFHSSSDIMTASSAEVWGGELPYLISVESPESEENVPDFISKTEVSAEDFCETVKTYCSEADFSADMSLWVNDAEYSESGRLDTVCIGGVTVTGSELRKLFSLRSAAIGIEVGDNVILTATGYGHGVGMSQYGAEIMAENGSTYEDILLHYYTGVKIVKQ